MGGESRDEAGTGIEPLGHPEKALRQPGELAGAMALERPQRIAVALADQVGALDQFPHRFGDGAVKQESDQQRRHDHAQDREREFAAQLVQIFEDIAGGARGIDHAGNLVAHDHRHRGENADAGAPAHGIERGLVVLGNAHAQRAAEMSLQCLGHFLQMRERQSDLVAAGDDDAVGVEQPESGQRHVLGGDQIRHHARPERDEGGIGGGGRGAGFRPRWQHALIGQFQRRPDRPIRFVRRLCRGRRYRGAERCVVWNCGFDLAVENRAECRALRDQFGLGLLDQLILVDLEKIETEQRQRQHAGENQKHHEAQTRPPLLPQAGRRSGHIRQREASQRPSLKPTPCTVSITDSQPAAAILARMLRTWLSMVRSAT